MKSLIGCSVRESFPLVSTVAKAKSTFAANELSVLSASASLWRLVWSEAVPSQKEAICALPSSLQCCCMTNLQGEESKRYSPVRVFLIC